MATLARKLGWKNEARIENWEQTGLVSLSHVNRVAKITHTPLGFLFLDKPPEEGLPIPDFRTFRNRQLSKPSIELIETVQTMQRRQDWMREYCIEKGYGELPFVGSRRMDDDASAVASDMRSQLGFARGWAASYGTWSEALIAIRNAIENLRILIFINGVVGNNTSRKLDPDEFRGFAISDSQAPLIFINNSDFKSAQMFTIAHELAHIWIGENGVSGFESLQPAPFAVEQACDRIAAEFLVPAIEFREAWQADVSLEDQFSALARRFKVSPIVVGRRAKDLGAITPEQFVDFYRTYAADERRKQAAQDGGGSFWNNQNVRIGDVFGRAIVRAAFEGTVLFRDAYSLTGLNAQNFDKFASTHA